MLPFLMFRPRHPLRHPALPARTVHFLSTPAPSALRITALSHIACFIVSLFCALSDKRSKVSNLFSNPSALFGETTGGVEGPLGITLKPLLQMAHPYRCTCKKGPAAREPRYSPCAAS